MQDISRLFENVFCHSPACKRYTKQPYVVYNSRRASRISIAGELSVVTDDIADGSRWNKQTIMTINSEVMITLFKFI